MGSPKPHKASQFYVATARIFAVVGDALVMQTAQEFYYFASVEYQ